MKGWMQRVPLGMRRRVLLWRGETLMFVLWVFRKAAELRLMRAAYRTLVRRMVDKSGLFDADFYLELNNDVAESGVDPLKHYVNYGDREGRCPMAMFEPRYYRSRVSGFTHSVNSLLHYVQVGRYRGISPSPWFDIKHYQSQNRDVVRAGIDPLQHYLRWGGLEGRSPNPQFDGAYYLNANADVREAGWNPLLHYIYYGRFEGRPTRQSTPKDSHQAPVAPETDDPEGRKEAKSGQRIGASGQLEVKVDVVVPVYKNRALTMRCLNSVLAAGNSIGFELVVIDDCSPELEITGDLTEMALRGLIRLVSNESNLGFVASVNKGMSLHPDRDIVLLNSDTEVYDGWLDRLYQTAYRDDDVASVTPLSNNATICSYPRFLHDNPYPLEIEYSALDRLAERSNAGVAVEAPTGVGFCMYIRRSALDSVGLFDEAAFGKGYGEENDWSQRAIVSGKKNLIAADVFVRHFGSASFQGERAKRVADAMKVLATKHPSYQNQIRDFIEADPLFAARQRLDLARLKNQKREENILLVCHNRGGGAEQHLQEDAARFRNEGKGVFFMRPVRGRPSHIRIQHQFCRQLLNLPNYRFADTEGVAGVLQELGITIIHTHGMVDFEPEAPLHLSRLARRLGVPLHVDIHDYKVICPRINLADEDGRYCGEPSQEECNTCLRSRGNDFRVTDISRWREIHHQLLQDTEMIWVPNSDVAERIGRYYPDVVFHVAPHENIVFGLDQLHIPQLAENAKLRIVVIGAIGKIKGYEVLLACAKDARKRSLPLEFVVMGHSIKDALLEKMGVRITGMYRDAEAAEVLRKIGPHVAFLPSLWPETYSYTLSIALKAGLPVLAFDLGAISERLRSLGKASLLMPLGESSRPHMINDKFVEYRRTMLAGNRRRNQESRDA